MKSFKFVPRILAKAMEVACRGNFAQLFGPTPEQIALQQAITKLEADVTLMIMLPQLLSPLPYRNWFPKGATPEMIWKVAHIEGNLAVLSESGLAHKRLQKVCKVACNRAKAQLY